MSTIRISQPPPLELDLLEEPSLFFAGRTLARDPKVGLLAGPAGLDTPLHPSEIDIALVGTGTTIEAGLKWIDECTRGIAGNPKTPRQVRDFPGFAPTSPFKSVLRPQQTLQGSSPIWKCEAS